MIKQIIVTPICVRRGKYPSGLDNQTSRELVKRVYYRLRDLCDIDVRLNFYYGCDMLFQYGIELFLRDTVNRKWADAFSGDNAGRAFKTTAEVFSVGELLIVGEVNGTIKKQMEGSELNYLSMTQIETMSDEEVLEYIQTKGEFTRELAVFSIEPDVALSNRCKILDAWFGKELSDMERIFILTQYKSRFLEVLNHSTHLSFMDTKDFLECKSYIENGLPKSFTDADEIQKFEWTFEYAKIMERLNSEILLFDFDEIQNKKLSIKVLIEDIEPDIVVNEKHIMDLFEFYYQTEYVDSDKIEKSIVVKWIVSRFEKWEDGKLHMKEESSYELGSVIKGLYYDLLGDDKLESSIGIDMQLTYKDGLRKRFSDFIYGNCGITSKIDTKPSLSDFKASLANLSE